MVVQVPTLSLVKRTRTESKLFGLYRAPQGLNHNPKADSHLLCPEQAYMKQKPIQFYKKAILGSPVFFLI